MGYTKAYHIERRFRCVSEEMIAEIQRLYLDEQWTHWMIATKYGISQYTSSAICRAIPRNILRATAQAKALRERVELRRETNPKYTEKDKAKMMRRVRRLKLPKELKTPRRANDKQSVRDLPGAATAGS